MKPTLVFLSLLLLLAGCREKSADSLRLDHSIEPVSQRIILSLDPEEDTYSGSVEIKIEIKEMTRQLRFHGRDLEIASVQLQSETKNESLAFSEGEKGTITATAPSKLKPGTYTLLIDFNNNYSRQGTGIYKVEYEGQSYLFTQMEPEYARESFPCWDAPEFKIPWQMELTIPADMEVYANTPIQSEHTGRETKTLIYRQTPRMPSYLLALAVGGFEHKPVSYPSVPGNIITPKDKLALAEEAIRVSPPLLRALETYFEIPYPYAKLDQIAVPEFNSGAMENVGLITYRDTALLHDPNAITLRQKQWLATIVAHELSHMWFGNLVTPKWWDDLWLNESFASWIALKMVNQVYPEYEMQNNDIHSRQRAMRTDSLSTTYAIRRPVAGSDDMTHLFDALAYNKGMAVLDMIENWMGEEDFRKGMVKYMNDHAWGNADAFDLAESLGTVVESDVLTILKSFVTQAGIPHLTIRFIDASTIEVSQQRYTQYNVEIDENPFWMIPIVLKYGSSGKTYRQKILLTERTRVFRLDHPAEWLYPNADEKGYYRWELPPLQAEALAATLPELDIRNRIGFLNNLDALFNAGKVDADIFLGTLASLSEDPSPEVRKSVVGKLNGFADILIPPKYEEAYGSFLREVFLPMLEAIGIDKAEGEHPLIETLRPSLIGALGRRSEEPSILRLSSEKAEAYMSDPYSVDPSLARTFLKLAARHGDKQLFDRFVEKYESATIPAEKSNYLNALSAFRDPELMDRGLAYTLTDAVPPHQFATIPRGFAEGDPNRKKVLEWIKEYYPAIQDKIPERSISYLPWLACGQSPELFEEAKAFFLADERRTQGLEIECREADAVMDLNTGLREKEHDNIKQFLGL